MSAYTPITRNESRRNKTRPNGPPRAAIWGYHDLSGKRRGRQASAVSGASEASPANQDGSAPGSGDSGVTRRIREGRGQACCRTDGRDHYPVRAQPRWSVLGRGFSAKPRSPGRGGEDRPPSPNCLWGMPGDLFLLQGGGRTMSMSATDLTADLITAVDAAAMIGISRSTFDSWVAAGLAPAPTFRIGKTIRWSQSEIAAWVAAGAPTRREWEVRHKPVRRKAK